MLFNFQKFINDLRDNKEKKDVVLKYEKLFGELTGEVKDQIWYNEFVSHFIPVDYNKPEELIKDFDWNLLSQLVAASFSSDAFCLIKNETNEFLIDVENGDTRVKKLISEIWGFQILRLFEIYCEEQMNLQILIAEDEKEREAILKQREKVLKRWNNELISIPIKKHLHPIENEILSFLD
ncbi:MAG: hypothetical protein AAGA77_14260 [Bacteroidota bacterium]